MPHARSGPDPGLDVEPILSGFCCSCPVNGRKRLKLLVAESSDSEPLVFYVPAYDDSGGNLLDQCPEQHLVSSCSGDLTPNAGICLFHCGKTTDPLSETVSYTIGCCCNGFHPTCIRETKKVASHAKMILTEGSDATECDVEYPPGFEPCWESAKSSLSPSLLEVNIGAKIDGKSESSTNLFSGPLAVPQRMLVNELYISSKQSLFHYFEKVIAEEITNCLCFGLESSIDQVQIHTPKPSKKGAKIVASDAHDFDIQQDLKLFPSKAPKRARSSHPTKKVVDGNKTLVVNDSVVNNAMLTKPVKKRKGSRISIGSSQSVKQMNSCPESDGCARASISGWGWHNWAQNATPSERACVRGYHIRNILSASNNKSWKNSCAKVSSARTNRVKIWSLLAAPESAELLRTTQMKARKKRLCFQRSKIHKWGLVALEVIEPEEFIIQYVGELIRRKVSDKEWDWEQLPLSLG